MEEKIHQRYGQINIFTFVFKLQRQDLDLNVVDIDKKTYFFMIDTFSFFGEILLSTEGENCIRSDLKLASIFWG